MSAARRRRVVSASLPSSEDGSALNAVSRLASVTCGQDVGGDLRKPFAPTSVSGSMSSACRRRVRLAVGAGGVSRRTQLCVGRSKLGKECATHFDFDFWYTPLGKVHGGHLPDQLATDSAWHLRRPDFAPRSVSASMSSACCWRIVGEIRRWLRTERHLAVGVSDIRARCPQRPPHAIRT